jgi:hypothetical protein
MIKLNCGEIKAKVLKDLIKDIADDEPIVIVIEEMGTGIGYDADKIDLVVEPIEDGEPPIPQLYIIG